MKKIIVSIVLGVCSLISQAQNVISPSGGGTVSFGSAGGGWQNWHTTNCVVPFH